MNKKMLISILLIISIFSIISVFAFNNDGNLVNLQNDTDNNDSVEDSIDINETDEVYIIDSNKNLEINLNNEGSNSLENLQNNKTSNSSADNFNTVNDTGYKSYAVTLDKDGNLIMHELINYV